MLRNLMKRIAVLGCLLIMAALIPTMASAANPVWVKIAEKGITNNNNKLLFPGIQFNGNLAIGSDPTPIAKSSPSLYSMYMYDGNFTQLGSDNFGDTFCSGFFPYATYKNELYIGTMNLTSGGRLYRWSGSGDPTEVPGAPWIAPANYVVSPLGVMNDRLLVCICSKTGTSGLQIYSFDGTSWTQLIGQGSAGTPTGPGFGDTHNEAILQFPETIYDGKMILPVQNLTDGFQVYSYDGSSFTMIGQAGAGSWNSTQVSGSAAFCQTEGLLYLGTGTSETSGSGQLWSYNGSAWSQVSATGLDAGSTGIMPLARGEDLYLSTANSTSGCRVYRRAGGSFEAICDPGLGDINNQGAVLTSYNGSLLALTGNGNGGQVYVTTIPPSIDQVTPSSGPYGTTITIEGHDFGVTQGSGGAASTVTINGKTAEMVSWSDTSVQAIVPTKAATGAVQVHTSTGDSNQVTFTLTLSKTWYFAEGTTRDNAVDGR
ncbi:MAG: IPT/TIG domain-containing protein, partial [Actinobacteria bacterium]|nr:IPT/TIG domain-containing protein [Actinomycetota bacterium]